MKMPKEQQEIIDRFNETLEEIRKEVRSWRGKKRYIEEKSGHIRPAPGVFKPLSPNFKSSGKE